MPQYLENNGTPISMEYCTLIETCRTSQRARSRRSYYTESTVGPQQTSEVEIRDLDVADYREQVIQTLSSARDIAVQAIRRAQGRYKFYYDRKAHSQTFKMGECGMT